MKTVDIHVEEVNMLTGESRWAWVKSVGNALDCARQCINDTIAVHRMWGQRVRATVRKGEDVVKVTEYDPR
jgi:hypothetical protein